jgi:type II secretory pathway pseudopilin PulG
MTKMNVEQSNQTGQTLIETIVAIFIIVTVLAAGVGTTIYIFSRSDVIGNQLIATELAREGIEVVRNMRDTNWLLSDASTDTSYALQTCPDINASCWPKVLDGAGGSVNYVLRPGSSPTSYRLLFDSATNKWNLDTGTGYELYLHTAPSDDPSSLGSYSRVGWASTDRSIFSRKIIMRENTDCPDTDATCSGKKFGKSSLSNSELIIQSIVAWKSGSCGSWSGTDPASAPNNCKVTIEEHLTNWKDYR